jgi:hypothetical protein
MIRIYSAHSHRPDLLGYQAATLRRFMREEHELVVLNNGAAIMGPRLWWEARRLGLRSTRVDGADRSTPNYAHATALRFCCERLLRYDDDVSIILDADMFLCRPCSIRELMAGASLGGLTQTRVEHGIAVRYLWPGLLILDMAHLPDRDDIDLWPDRVNGVRVDVGGHLWNYLHAHPDLPIRSFTETPIQSARGTLSLLPGSLDPPYRDEYRIEIHAGAFLHYRGASDWAREGAAYHRAKTAWLTAMLDRLLAGEAAMPAELPMMPLIRAGELLW